MFTGRGSAETRRWALIVIAAALAIANPATAAPLTLRESGSMLIAPLFEAWAHDYAGSHADVTVTTAGTGSRRGAADVFSGTVQIGASDTFLSDYEARTHPGFVDIALAVSAVEIAYNLPDLKAPLKLDGPTLAAIYAGTAQVWDDPAIAALNPGVALPHHEIVPVRLPEDAGETAVLEQYLSATREDDLDTRIEMPSDAFGRGTGRKVAAARDAQSNDAMVATLARTPFSIGYLAFPFADKAAQAKLGTAAMQSDSEEFLLPGVRTIAASAAALTLRTPADERFSLVDAPGTSCYPLINYEYAIVATRQGSETQARAIREFLSWAIMRNAASFERLAAAHLVALPSSTWLKSLLQIDLIR